MYVYLAACTQPNGQIKLLFLCDQSTVPLLYSSLFLDKMNDVQRLLDISLPFSTLPITHCVHYNQRWLYRKIYKREMEFWAVLGRRGCRQQKLNCHKYATFWGGFFNFLGQKKIIRFSFKFIFASALKSCIIKPNKHV